MTTHRPIRPFMPRWSLLIASMLLTSITHAQASLSLTEHKSRHYREISAMQKAVSEYPADWMEQLSHSYQAKLDESYQAAQRAMINLNEWEIALNESKKEGTAQLQDQSELDHALGLYQSSMKALARTRLKTLHARKQETKDRAEGLVREASLICDVANRLCDSERELWIKNAMEQAMDDPEQFKKRFIIEGINGVSTIDLLFQRISEASEVEMMQKEVEFRQRAIEKMLVDLSEINAIFKDLMLIVRHQDESLKKIERSLEQTKHHIQSGLKELEKAQKYSKKRFLCCFPCF